VFRKIFPLTSPILLFDQSPTTRKEQDAPPDIKHIRVSGGTTLLDQRHCIMGRHALSDQNRGAHGNTAMASVGTVHVDFPAAADHIERCAHAACKSAQRNGEQRIVKRVKPEILNMQIVGMRLGSAREAHVDHQPHAQTAQDIIIPAARRGADEQVVGDLRKVHGRILSRVVYNFMTITASCIELKTYPKEFTGAIRDFGLDHYAVLCRTGVGRDH